MKGLCLLAALLCCGLFCACQQDESDLIDPSKVVAPPPVEEQSTDIPPIPDENKLDPPAESPAADPETTKAAVTGEGFLTDVENQVMNLINQERLSLGLTELEYEPMLQNAARIRSKELCQKMFDVKLSHSRPDGSLWQTVLTEDIPIQGLVEAGEILAREKTTNGNGNIQDPIPAKDWFLLWKASEPHYNEITWPEAQKFGVGIYYEIRDGEYYTNATVLFGRYAPPAPDTQN